MRIDNVKIVMVPVNEIIPYWRNPRRNDKTVDALVEVIQKNGFNVPIVLDRNNVVVKGHARLRAAKRLGMEEVPCVISDASEDVIKADRISDNKIQELSSWDFGKLDVELESHKTPMFDKLFKLEESPIAADDVGQMDGIGFTPIGLGDYDFGDDGGATGEIVSGTSATYEVRGDGAAENTFDSGAENAVSVVPQPRQIRTLCPYCGKVVVVNV